MRESFKGAIKLGELATSYWQAKKNFVVQKLKYTKNRFEKLMKIKWSISYCVKCNVVPLKAMCIKRAMRTKG